MVMKWYSGTVRLSFRNSDRSRSPLLTVSRSYGLTWWSWGLLNLLCYLIAFQCFMKLSILQFHTKMTRKLDSGQSSTKWGYLIYHFYQIARNINLGLILPSSRPVFWPHAACEYRALLMNGHRNNKFEFNRNIKLDFSAKQTGGVGKKHAPPFVGAGYYFVKAGICTKS